MRFVQSIEAREKEKVGNWSVMREKERTRHQPVQVGVSNSEFDIWSGSNLSLSVSFSTERVPRLAFPGWHSNKITDCFFFGFWRKEAGRKQAAIDVIPPLLRQRQAKVVSGQGQLCS
jgi:hypothetical protein